MLASAEPARQFANGFPTDPGFFPIGVWLQKPNTASNYRAIGINTFIAQWETPTAQQMAQFAEQGLFLILEPSPATRALPHAHIIRGWMHTDEPDNAQSNGRGGYGDCILPEEVVRRYQEMRSADPTRPVLVIFGQAVANPQWFGRGHKCSQITPRDYYSAASHGADIVSYDIYPVAEERQTHVMGRLELVGRGVANLKRWTTGQPVWNVIETTHIRNANRRPMPHEIRSQVWMSLIHGSTGISYFVHEWKPSFREDAVFRYPDNVQEIARINGQVKSLAPVLNSATLASRVKVDAPVEIATMVKLHAGSTYVFAVNMAKKPATARLSLAGLPDGDALVLGEDRIVRVHDGAIEDEFGEYGVHLYRIAPPK